MGDRLRLSVQLVAARSGLTIWAERYDRDLADLFSAQDEISAEIIATLAGVVEEEGAQVVARKRTESMEAYDFLLRGMYLARKLDPGRRLRPSPCSSGRCNSIRSFRWRSPGWP